MAGAGGSGMAESGVAVDGARSWTGSSARRVGRADRRPRRLSSPPISLAVDATLDRFDRRPSSRLPVRTDVRSTVARVRRTRGMRPADDPAMMPPRHRGQAVVPSRIEPCRCSPAGPDRLAALGPTHHHRYRDADTAVKIPSDSVIRLRCSIASREVIRRPVGRDGVQCGSGGSWQIPRRTGTRWPDRP